jgi:CelD/BcsL family acetyltransferase involved in cellulose biosynthesis
VSTVGKQQGALLFGLEVSGKLIAVQYCLISNQTCHYYQSGFDETFQPNVSPGLLCHVIAHEQCERLGITSYDLMKAQADAYKASLAAKQYPLAVFKAFRSRTARAKHKLVSVLGGHRPTHIIQGA